MFAGLLRKVLLNYVRQSCLRCALYCSAFVLPILLDSLLLELTSVVGAHFLESARLACGRVSLLRHLGRGIAKRDGMKSIEGGQAGLFWY